MCRVLGDLHQQLAATPHRLVLTINDGSTPPSGLNDLPDTLLARLDIRTNTQPLGFGANHNAALRGQCADFILMADPDLSIDSPIFPALESHLAVTAHGVAAPLAVTPNGIPEDNGRDVVTPMALWQRYRPRRGSAPPVPATAAGATEVDWVAGLFMAMRTETFTQLNGFDERYFLYCEDVDLCLRARALGLSVTLLQDLRITHPARRKTLKHPQHLAWHLASMLRLWRSPAYRQFRRQQRSP